MDPSEQHSQPSIEMVQDPTKNSPLRSESDQRDAARTHPELIKGLVVDVVRARGEHTLRGTGKIATTIHLILLLICFGMAGITYSGLLSNVRLPIVLSPLRMGASTWALFGIAVSLFLFAAQWKRRHANEPRHVRLSNTLVLLVFASYMVASNFSFYGYLLIELVPALIFFTSGAFSIAWSIDPAGRIALQCSKCKYEFTASQSAPDLCPECGASWLRDKGLTRRRLLEFSSPILFTGVIALLFGILALVAVPTLHSRVPTQWLLPKAHGTALGMSDGEWARLAAENIDEEQRRQLAETLLLRRKRQPFMPRGGDQWYQAAIAASLLPEDLVGSYFAEMLDVSIDAPKDIQRGVPFPVSLKTNTRSASPFYAAAYVWFEGYRLDGALLANQTPGLADISDFGNITNRGFGRVEHGNSPPIATIEIPTTGEHTIQACYWIIGYARTHNVITVGTDHISLSLDEAGRPVMDPKWHYLERFVVSTTITVTGDD